MFIGSGALWVFFYPNAPYLITDFIHLSRIKFYFARDGYNMDFIVWYDLVMFSLFILTGFLLGFVSLYLIQRLLADRFNKVIGWLSVIGTLFLSSFGIYLGRFIRWNTWDIIANPAALLDSILGSLHRYAFAFTVTFGLFLLLIYAALYYLTKLNQHKVVVLNRETRD
jgi:Predicted membrane protein